MHISKEGLLAYFPKMRSTRYTNVVETFGGVEPLWTCSIAVLCAKLGWKKDFAAEFVAWRSSVNMKKIKTELDADNIRIVSFSDAEYPALLREIHSPPVCLFVRGSLAGLGAVATGCAKDQTKAVAVVGTRAYSEYGKLACEKIIREFGETGADMAVVSGLAYGIDSIAHRTALLSGLKTIAVLGSGIDSASITPVAHCALAEKIIAAGGAVVSEYPPGFAPTKYSFPERNRIIAGMSLGTLVVEAAEKSGALITADFALNQNREVFAVPHPITSRTGIGPNKLISDGAHVALSGLEILDTLGIARNKTQNNKKELIATTMTPNERAVYGALQDEPMYIDAIFASVDLKNSDIASTLTTLELKRLVQQLPGKKYIRINLV